MNMRDLLNLELRDLYSAETQLLDALPKMQLAASNADLKKAFADHLEETQQQLDRLNNIAFRLKINIKGEECQAMKGLIKEGEDIITQIGEPAVKDAALIAAAQRVEHYEIAAYGSAACFAGHCNEDEVEKLLHETLKEEGASDKALNKLATGKIFSSGINNDAVKASK